MRRRDFLAVFPGTAFVRPSIAIADAVGGVPRVGVLMGGTPAIEAPKLGAFREALERLGYVNGRTIHIEPRYAEGLPERIERMARDLVEENPTVIVCVGRQETTALQAATRTIPIVFLQIADPVEMGIAATLARPGGNATGFAQMSGELDSKRLEMLHAIAPSLSHAALLVDPRLTPGLERRVTEAMAAAKNLGIALRRVDATTPAEVAHALAGIDASSGEALLLTNDPLFAVERTRIIDFAAAHHLPTVFEQKPPVAQGALIGYGPDLIENARSAATYVDKILKGAKPADLPVQQPTKFELVINLKTAKALGLTVPQSLLGFADEVIE